MMAEACATIQRMASLSSPASFKSAAEDPDTNLRNFNRIVRSFKRWIQLMGTQDMAIMSKWALFIHTRGEGMETIKEYQAAVQIYPGFGGGQ